MADTATPASPAAALVAPAAHRHPLRRGLLTATWIACFAFLPFRLRHWSSLEFGDELTQFMLIPPFLFAASGALLGAEGRSRQAARGLRSLSLAWLVSVAGVLCKMIAGEREQLSWLWSTGAFLYNLYYPFELAGLWLLAERKATPLRRAGALLEGLMVAGACQLLLWYFVLRANNPGNLSGQMVNIVVTGAGELSVLVGATWLLSSAGGRPELPLRLLGAAALLAALGDLANLQAALRPSPRVEAISDCLVVISASLVATAGALRPGQKRRRRLLVLELVGRAVGHIPSLALGVVLVLVVVEARLYGRSSDPIVLLALGAAALSALAILGLTLYQIEVAEEADARTQQAQRLQQAERFATMGQLASAVAHDFNNLVAAIKAISEELQARRSSPAEAAELVSISDRAAALCGQLLALGRSGSRGPEAVELSGLAIGLEPLLRRLLPRTLRFELEAPVPVAARCDRGQLELALLNLVVNARDAVSPEGAITVRVLEVLVTPGSALALRGVKPGRCAQIVVEDDGKGMDAATQARIFEPFFTTKGLRGTGLGLPLVAEVVRSAGGQVLLDSAPGRGSVFTLVMPAVE